MERLRPTRVSDTLRDVLQRMDPEHRMKVFRVWTFWDEEVGESVARHAQPDGFRAGVLSVRVDNPSWMQELQFLKEAIRARLNQRLGEALIRDVYFVSGKTAPAEKAPAAPTKPGNSRPSRRAVPIPRLRDGELAEVFKRIALAHSKRERD